jgi:molybdate/tungstate transport system substrate-binding protein
MNYKILQSGFLILCTIVLISCNSANKPGNSDKNNISGDIIIFHAGSLSVPFQKIARAFAKEYPGTRVLLEAAGSIDCARKITDLHKPCDLLASSDYKVITQLLIPAHTSWYMPFAGNEMVIAYTGKSNYGNSINRENWHEILQKVDVRYGRSDPDRRPVRLPHPDGAAVSR